MNRLVWQRFTRQEWMAFSGASCFADGSDPLVGELRVDGETAFAIFDGSGVYVEIMAERAEDDFEAFTCPQGRAAQAIALLSRDTTRIALLDVFGFQVQP